MWRLPSWTHECIWCCTSSAVGGYRPCSFLPYVWNGLAEALPRRQYTCLEGRQLGCFSTIARLRLYLQQFEGRVIVHNPQQSPNGCPPARYLQHIVNRVIVDDSQQSPAGHLSRRYLPHSEARVIVESGFLFKKNRNLILFETSHRQQSPGPQNAANTVPRGERRVIVENRQQSPGPQLL